MISSNFYVHTLISDLTPWTNLITLQLLNNCIRSEEITDILTKLTNIWYLNLRNNSIDNIGAINLAETSLNSNIKLIDLGWNHINNEGALKMSEILIDKDINIDLSYNMITKNTMDKIKLQSSKCKIIFSEERLLPLFKYKL